VKLYIDGSLTCHSTVTRPMFEECKFPMPVLRPLYCSLPCVQRCRSLSAGSMGWLLLQERECLIFSCFAMLPRDLIRRECAFSGLFGCVLDAQYFGC
jgi:hypothetical protein